MELIALLLSVAFLAISLFSARRTLAGLERSGRFTPRLRTAIRLGRLVTWAAGAGLMIWGLTLAIQKIAHIRAGSTVTATIDGVQKSPHEWTPYTFVVRYEVSGKTFRRYAFTSAMFARKEGDRITILFDPRNPGEPEALVFDSDWLLCSILLAAGGALFLSAGWIYGWRDPPTI